MTTLLIDAAGTMLGWSLAAAAWAFALATYPLVVCYVFALAKSWAAFEQSLVDLRESWADRELQEAA